MNGLLLCLEKRSEFTVQITEIARSCVHSAIDSCSDVKLSDVEHADDVVLNEEPSK